MKNFSFFALRQKNQAQIWEDTREKVGEKEKKNLFWEPSQTNLIVWYKACESHFTVNPGANS